MSERYFLHFDDGRLAWKKGFFGFFLRKRGIYISLLLSVLFLTGKPWWWPESFSKILLNKTISPLLILLFLLLLSIFGLYYLRKRSLRSLDLKHYLHQLNHYLRDHQTFIYKLVKENENQQYNFHQVLSNTNFTQYIEDICNRVKIYFRRLTYDNSIECAIRLATYNDIGKKNKCYKTIARSSGLSIQRRKTSECISDREGVPRVFSECNYNGVLIYYDLKKAADNYLYKLTESDIKYPTEIKSFLAVPLNAWAGDGMNMIGILFITSMRKKTFKMKYVDNSRMLADIIAHSISFTTNELKKLEK